MMADNKQEDGINSQDNVVVGTDIPKPTCKLVGEDGNIFAILGRASGSLRQVNCGQKAVEMINRVKDAPSYDDALQIVMEYVEVE